MKLLKKPLLILSIFSFLLTGCGADTSEEEQTDTSVAVEVQTVSRADMASSNTIAGQVVPISAVQVFPMLAGKVTSVNVSDGDTVSKGQVLFTIDTSTVSSSLGALQQSYSATKAATDQAIATANIGVQNAKLGVEQAQTALSNVQALYEVGAASSQQVTQAENALTQAQSGLEQANLAVLQATASQQSTLAQIQSSIDQINSQIALGTVTAPVDGKISSVSVTVGGMAAQSAPAMVIAAYNEYMVSVSVSESVQSGVKVGDVGSVTISSISNEPYACAVRTVSGAINPQTGLYDITLYLPEDISPSSGAFADVTLYTNHRQNTIQIPTEAILTDGETSYVYVVSEENTAIKTPVITGLVGEGITEITEGLNEGDTVVVKGQSYLSDSSAVRIVEGED